MYDVRETIKRIVDNKIEPDGGVHEDGLESYWFDFLHVDRFKRSSKWLYRLDVDNNLTQKEVKELFDYAKSAYEPIRERKRLEQDQLTLKLLNRKISNREMAGEYTVARSKSWLERLMGK